MERGLGWQPPLFRAFLRAEERVAARAAHGCRCPQCLIDAEAPAEVLGALAAWKRQQRDAGEFDTVLCLRYLLDALEESVARTLRMAPPVETPDTYKVPPMVMLHWLMVRVTVDCGYADPQCLIRRLERGGAGHYGLLCDAFANLVHVLEHEQLPRDCAPHCPAQDPATCFQRRVAHYLAENGALPDDLYSDDPESSDGSIDADTGAALRAAVARRRRQRQRGRGSDFPHAPTTCALLGCDRITARRPGHTTDDDESDEDDDDDDNHRPAQRNPRRLARCSACRAAYYCCRDHQKRGWKLHRHICPQLRPPSQTRVN